MLNSKNLKNNILQLFVESKDKPFVIGNGILINMKIGFDEEKLEENKQAIATILQELGIDEHRMIRLSGLTTLKNGEVWNPLQSIEDFQALELLLACSHACGFIDNDNTIIEMNIGQISEISGISSILLLKQGIFTTDENEWLKFIKEVVIDNMYFFIDSENIKLSVNEECKIKCVS